VRMRFASDWGRAALRFEAEVERPVASQAPRPGIRRATRRHFVGKQRSPGCVPGAVGYSHEEVSIMVKHAFGLSLALGILGWAVPQRASAPASAELAPIRKDIGQLAEALAQLDNRLGHLESAPAASDLDPVGQEIAQLKEILARLDN